METWMFFLLLQVVLAPFTYKHYQNVLVEPPQPRKKRVLQSDKYKAQKAVTPLSKQGLKPSRPVMEPPKSGVQMVGGKARLVKAPVTSTPITQADEVLSPVIPPLPAPEIVIEADRPITKQFTAKAPLPSAPPPPPPPSIHSKLNPVKPPPAPVVPVQWGPTPIPPKAGIDVPERVLMKIDCYTYNRDISTRLVMNVAKKNPDKDGTWCAEKALWDIERDRH